MDEQCQYHLLKLINGVCSECELEWISEGPDLLEEGDK